MTNHDPDLVARLKDEIKRLNLECNALSQRNTLLVMKIEILHKERDEARREVCKCKVHQQHDPVQLAQDRGWDCFKEKFTPEQLKVALVKTMYEGEG